MKTKLNLIQITLLCAVFSTLNLQPSTAFAQGTTAFTYQGQLHDSGTNANGAYTMIFALYDAVTNGDQIGVSITNSPTLANGLFTVNLDFGAGAFDGPARWLDITVQSGSDSEELTPRVVITPAPYALYAMSAGNQTNPPSSGGTINTTSITLGGGGTSWDIGTDASNSLTFTYGDPLYTKMDTNGDLDVPDGIYCSTVLATNLMGIGDWYIKNGTLNGITGLGFFNGGALLMAIADNGQIDQGGGQPGMMIFGDSVFQNSLEVGQGFFANGNITAGGNISAAGEISCASISASNLTINPIGGEVDYDADIRAFNIYTYNVNAEALWVTNGIKCGGSVNVGDIFQIDTENQTVGVWAVLNAENDLNAGTINANGITTCGITAVTYNYGTCDCPDSLEGIAAVDSQKVLESVAKLPVSTWNSAEDKEMRHIAPTAQDFNAAFGLNHSNKSINLVDEIGVSLAAIQGLNQKLDEKDAQIKALEKRLADLEQLVKSTSPK